jgi:1,4-dihydroxy-2-naphthoyl-CoA hydrolase
MAKTDDTVPNFDSGWSGAMGLVITHMDPNEVVAEWTVGPQHLQPFGIVHGGVHSGVVETVCSVGAAINAAPQGQTVVGVENHTSFLRAVREGKLRAVAKPLHVGKRAQLWEANITDEEGRLVATGRVRLFGQDGGGR